MPGVVPGMSIYRGFRLRVVHESEMRSEPAPHADHCGTGSEGVDGDARKRRNLRRPCQEIAQYRRNICSPIRTHADKGSGRNFPVSRIDDDTYRGKGKLMLGRNPGHHVRLHIDRSRARRCMQFPFLSRLGDRFIDADNRRMDSA